MTTIEQFYFNPEEVEVTAGSEGKTGWHLTFIPVEDPGVYLKISALDRRTFTELLARIQSVGQALLDMHDQPDDAASDTGAAPHPETRHEP